MFPSHSALGSFIELNVQTLMVGAMVLARAVDDEELSREILDQVKSAYQ